MDKNQLPQTGTLRRNIKRRLLSLAFEFDETQAAMAQVEIDALKQPREKTEKEQKQTTEK